MLERLINWLIDLTHRYWIPVVLMALLVSITSYSLDEANWVQKDSRLVGVFVAGIVFGWMLSISSYRAWFVIVYSVIISAFLAFEAVANIIPSLGLVLANPSDQLFDQINLRAWQFYLRVTGWVETIRAGENIRDTGLFVLLIGVILALSGIWLMWWLIRKHKALYGLLPLGFLLAINMHLSRQSLTNYVIFLFCALLLSARSTFVGQHRDWEERRVDYPEQIGMEWAMSAVVLVLLVVMAARAAPAVGTREGWRAMADWAAKAREQTNTTSTRLFSGVNPPPPSPDDEPVIYVNTPNLDEIGSPIPQGFETVMLVKISDPPPLTLPYEATFNTPSVATKIHYWRSGIFSTYTGRGWEQALMTSDQVQQSDALPETPPLGRYYLRQDYDIVARHSGTLFSVNEPAQTSLNVYLRNTAADGSNVLEGQPDAYQVVSTATNVTANQLADASTAYPDAIRAAYLQLPDTLPVRVRVLSQRLTNSARDPYHKAIIIQNYLRDNYPYDLASQLAPAKRDVVDYFLFDLNRGFCTHYATAMSVMMRTLGIPSRVVTGYAMGDYDQKKQAYRVPVSAAHAWVEVYFPGYGWIEFEPTAYREPFKYSEATPSNETAAAVPQVRVPPSKAAQPYLLALSTLAALALLSLPFMLLRMFAPSRQAPAVQADTLYRRIRRALSWAGLPALTSVTPDEYLSLYAGRLESYRQLSGALNQATAVYRETIYSERPPDARKVQAASLLWQHSLGDWFSLLARTAWQKTRAKFTE